MSSTQWPHAAGSGPHGWRTSPSSRRSPLGHTGRRGLLENPCSLFPSHDAWSGSLPATSPRDPEGDRLIPSHLMETGASPGTHQGRQLAAQVCSAGRTYLCRALPRQGGRWPPAPAKWPAAHHPRCPASPWRPGAGQRQLSPSACPQAENKGREGEAVRGREREAQTRGKQCGRFISTVNYPQLGCGVWTPRAQVAGQITNVLAVCLRSAL